MSGSSRITAVEQVIDLDRYPIDKLDSPKGRALVAFCRASLAFEGACQLPGFVRPEAVELLITEALEKRGVAYRTDDTHNVYFERIPDESSDNDPVAALQHSSKSAIAWDLIGPSSPLRIAYECDDLTRFLGEALGMPEFHRYADPLGAASLMLFEKGDELGWHFDRSPFAVTLMLQPSTVGGDYEYYHHLRSADDENKSDVMSALRGDLPGKIKLYNAPGTLSMFRGQYSLHRVSPIEGDEVRINAVLAYSAKPGDKLNQLTQELFYGRTA
ncbi:HalD/BesD family halogenase [Streptomyces sp. NPDC002519]